MNNFKLLVFVALANSYIVVESIEKPSNKRRRVDSQQLLFNGARVANFEAVKKALEDPSIDVNALDTEGETALTILAERSGYYDPEVTEKIIFYLLNNGARLDIKNKKNLLPIEVAGSIYSPNMNFLEAVDKWKNLQTYKLQIIEQILENTPLAGVLGDIVSDYSYEIQDPEIKALFAEQDKKKRE